MPAALRASAFVALSLDEETVKEPTNSGSPQPKPVRLKGITR